MGITLYQRETECEGRTAMNDKKFQVHQHQQLNVPYRPPTSTYKLATRG